MKRGVSLAILVLTIVVLSILLGIIVINSGYMVTDTELSILSTDIEQLEYLMNIYTIRKSGNIDFEIVDFNVQDLSPEELRQFSGETITDNIIKLYVIDYDSIDAENVNYGKQEKGMTDRYLYSKTTEKVYYEYGLSVNDKVYYYIENGEV